MQLLSQPFNGQLGGELTDALESGDFNTMNIAVAFARNSGVLRLRKTFGEFVRKGGKLNFYIGVDLYGTSYEALVNLLEVATSLWVIHDENGQTFHTKLFNLVAEQKSVLVVGSHNLTAGGLWTNYESSIRLDLDLNDTGDQQLQKETDAYFNRLQEHKSTALRIECDSDIQSLMVNGYIEKDVKRQVRRRQAASTPSQNQPLFGKGPRALLPTKSAVRANTRVTTSPMATPTGRKSPDGDSGRLVPLVENGASNESVQPALTNRQSNYILENENTNEATLWLETRKMTGGSRNILDLSKSSLLRDGDVRGTKYEHADSQFMHGAVEFFGINPEETEVEKNIVINFEGVDFVGNTIKFPTGKKANGTWRVQIKGVSTDGSEITKVFKSLADGEYLLPEKILAFTRVTYDYYYLSVFDESDLEEFQSASKIVAYNGRTKAARMLGIL